MFKRSRRSTICHVEQLEGRAALSTVVDSAFVIGVIDKVVHIRGYTTDVRAGEQVYVQVAQQITHPSTKIESYAVPVVNPNGSFFGSIHAHHPWHVGGELTVEIYRMLDPESTPQRYLLATEHIRITLD